MLRDDITDYFCIHHLPTKFYKPQFAVHMIDNRRSHRLGSYTGASWSTAVCVAMASAERLVVVAAKFMGALLVTSVSVLALSWSGVDGMLLLTKAFGFKECLLGRVGFLRFL